MKKTLTLTLSLSLFFSVFVSAQTVLYNQNFDGSSALPTGWYATPNSWFVDTTGNNSSSGYVGASGLNNVVIQDTTAVPGTDELISPAISTVGYHDITIEWSSRMSKHFADSGSAVTLYWATDSSNWQPITFTENPNNSNWYPDNDSTPILLPAGANNQPTLQIMWSAFIHFAPSGTYRIDDVTVAGAVGTGINSISGDQGFAKVYVANTNINIAVKQALTSELNVEVYDLTGRMVHKTTMETQTLTISGRDLSEGVYFVKVYGGDQSMTTKVLIKQ